MNEINDLNDLFTTSKNFDKDFEYLKDKAKEVKLKFDSGLDKKDITNDTEIITDKSLMHTPGDYSKYTDLATVSMEPISYRIEEFLPDECISMLYSHGGQGKTSIVLYLASLVATGNNFLDKEVKKGRVLYLDYELSEKIIRWKTEGIARSLNLTVSDITSNFHYLDINKMESNFNTTKITEIIPIIKKDDFDLIILDSIGAALTGDAEAARDICIFFQQLKMLGTVLVTDHQSKKQKGDRLSEKTPFGSVYKYNLSRNIWHLNSKHEEASENELNCTLAHTKSNFSAIKDNINLKLIWDNANIKFTVKPSEPNPELIEHLTGKDKALAAFIKLGAATPEEVAKEAKLQLLSARNRTTDLKKEGKIIETDLKRNGQTVCKPTIITEVGTSDKSSDYSFNKEDKLNKNEAIDMLQQELDVEVLDESKVPEEAPF